MPHVIVEYSANVEDWTDIASLCEALRGVMAGIDAFPTPGIRVRAFRASHVAIADGDSKHGFVDISIRIRGGRSDDVKADAADRVFAAAKANLATVLEDRSLALSLELRDIDPVLSPKFGTIRRHMPQSEN